MNIDMHVNNEIIFTAKNKAGLLSSHPIDSDSEILFLGIWGHSRRREFPIRFWGCWCGKLSFCAPGIWISKAAT